MTKSGRKWIARGLGFAWTWLGVSLGSAQLMEPELPPSLDTVEVQERVEAAFQTEDRVRVFLMLREAEAGLPAQQQSVLDALGSSFEAAHRYRSIPALAGVLTRDGLARVRAHRAVAAVQLDGTGVGGLAEALPAVGVDQVHSTHGLTGKGVTVAVLDSGASTQHPALQGAIVEEHCFTQRACPPSNSSEGESAEDDHNHGSNVTGVVASRGAGGIAKGYAPGANIVSVKVLNRNNAGQISDWVAGFDWVYSNLERLDVKVINASLASTAEYASAADCDRSESALAAITKRLVDAGVTITACSGNTGQTQTMSAPACNSGVIAVGATYDDDLGTQPESGGSYRALGGFNWPACADMNTNPKTIACFTSTAGSRLDVLAPGTQIVSVGRGTGRSLFRGTSQAAPGVAGLAALMLECNPMLTPAMILATLEQTGEPVMDPRTGMSYPLIRGMPAIEAACGMNMGGIAGAGAAGVGASGAGGSGAPGAAGMSGAAASGGTAGAAVGGRGGGTGVAGVPASGTAGSAPAPGTAGRPAPPSGGRPAAGIGGQPTGMPSGAVETAGAPAVPRAATESEPGCACSAPGARSPTPPGWGLISLAGLLGVLLRRRSLVRRTEGRSPQ